MNKLFPILLILVIVFILFFDKSDSPKQDSPKNKAEKQVVVTPQDQAKADSLRKKAIADSIIATQVWKYTELQPGEGVFQVLERMSIPHGTIMQIINKLRFEVELINLKAGERFAARFSNDSTRIIRFDYMPNRVVRHTINIDTLTDSLKYETERRKTEVRRKLVKGTLGENSTLNQSLLDAGFSRGITAAINGILLCKVAFRTDARVGDTFTVLLQEEFYKDTLVPEYTKVLYTSYSGRRAGFSEAFRFQDTEEKSSYTAHYTPDGEALVHSGLRYPINRLHVSSGYGWRIHPVTGRRKMHYGIDYAARTGTPVFAVAPGRVVMSSYEKYGGNQIAIKHADNSKSYYLHLSKRLVRKGAVVRSKQLIGKVGRTGRVTGPHLHFGFKSTKGKWINPNRKRMIATPKLKGKRLEALKKQIADIKSTRDKIISEKKVVIAEPKVPEVTDSTADSTATKP